MSENGRLQFIFSNDFGLSTSANTVFSGQINSAAIQNLAISITGTTITATGLFSSALVVTSGITRLTVSISPVRNTRYIGTSSISVSTMTTNNEKIDSMTVNQGANSPCSITYLLLLSSVPTVLLPSSLSIFYQSEIFDANLSNTYVIKFTFPPSFTLPSSTTCSIIAGISNTTLTNSLNINEFTTGLVAQSNQNVGLNFNFPINPPNTKTTDFFKIATYTSSGALICENNQFTTFKATASSISVSDKLRSSSLVGDTASFTLTFTTSTQMPSTSKIKVILPQDELLEDSGIICNTIISGIVSPNNICSKIIPPSDLNTYELLMTE